MTRTQNWLAVTVVAALLGGCAAQTGDPGSASADLLNMDYDASHATVTFEQDGAIATAEATVLPDVMEMTLRMQGMVLLMTADRATGVFDVDGFAEANGEDTQMVESDLALLVAFEGALTEPYQQHAAESPALDFLNRAITAWSGYSETMSLTRTFHGRLDRSSSLCANVNKPGQGVQTQRWQSATHDCGSTAGDCSNWTGCDRWDDNSSTSYVFMSMHPIGGCSDDTYFGGSSASFSCYEPDHPGGTEYAYGACFGRCGGGCGGGTAFTRDCVDHDQCVRLGHSIASFWCDDEFTGAAWDALWASNCSGVNLKVDYNWAGTSAEGNCPTSWNSTNDGCDVGCQFIDGDCFR